NSGPASMPLTCPRRFARTPSAAVRVVFGRQQKTLGATLHEADKFPGTLTLAQSGGGKHTKMQILLAVWEAMRLSLVASRERSRYTDSCAATFRASRPCSGCCAERVRP